MKRIAKEIPADRAAVCKLQAGLVCSSSVADQTQHLIHVLLSGPTGIAGEQHKSAGPTDKHRRGDLTAEAWTPLQCVLPGCSRKWRWSPPSQCWSIHALTAVQAECGCPPTGSRWLKHAFEQDHGMPVQRGDLRQQALPAPAAASLATGQWVTPGSSGTVARAPTRIMVFGVRVWSTLNPKPCTLDTHDATGEWVAGTHLAEVQQLVAEHAQELSKLDLAGAVHIVLGHDLHQLLVGQGVPQVLKQLRYLRGSDLACRVREV